MTNDDRGGFTAKTQGMRRREHGRMRILEKAAKSAKKDKLIHWTGVGGELLQLSSRGAGVV